jgi:serine/threonine protein kinase
MTDFTRYTFGRYHLLEKLGEGGMAVVYKAYDTRLEVNVAVKVIQTGNLPQNAVERALKRFEREAKPLTQLTHPNIVKVTDYGEYEGQPYLVMPYLPGGTLKEKLGKPIAWQAAVQLLLPVAGALGYAHSQNMIHRDVKPANILLTQSGHPMLSDFGIAKLLDLAETVDLTGTSAAIGTPEYMAPEQASAKTVDHRADIYALGIVLYEMVTGRRPFTADTPMAVLIMHARDPLPSPKKYAPGLSDRAEKILLKALAKPPEDRFQTMAEFSAALERTTGKPASEGTRTRTDFVPAIPDLSTRNEQPTATFTPTATTTPVFTSTPTVTPTPIATSTPALGIGSTWTSPADGMTMLYVPAGAFTMGDTAEQALADCQKYRSDCQLSWFTNEEPPHPVTLESYWIDQTEVTNAMYAKCVDAGKCTPPSSSKSYTRDSYYGNPQYADYPVIYVSWNNANAYCAWRGDSTRLPTEAEWEKAASWDDQTKTKRVYPWGDSLDCSFENYWPSNRACKGDTTKVGSYPWRKFLRFAGYGGQRLGMGRGLV